MAENPNPLLLTGRLLVELGHITEELLEKALLYQEGHRALNWPGKKLGEHLIRAELIDRKTLAGVLRHRDALAGEVKWAGLGEVAVQNGFISRHELHRALSRQRSGPIGRERRRLGPMMRELKLLSEQQLQAAIDRQRALYRAMRYEPTTKPGESPFVPGAPQALAFGS
jgi:hypothetical protein